MNKRSRRNEMSKYQMEIYYFHRNNRVNGTLGEGVCLVTGE